MLVGQIEVQSADLSKVLSAERHCDVYRVREVFEHEGRFLGTEYELEHWFEGTDAGWNWRHRMTCTMQFPTKKEMVEWRESLRRELQLERSVSYLSRLKVRQSAGEQRTTLAPRS